MANWRTGITHVKVVETYLVSTSSSTWNAPQHPPPPVSSFMGPQHQNPEQYTNNFNEELRRERFVNGNRRYMGPGGRGDAMHHGPPAPRGPGYGLLNPTGPPNSTQSSGGCVMMVYGLDKEIVNPDKLFNIFCLYGNVLKIKFSTTREDCAMVEMGDRMSVERCISNLNNSSVGDMTIKLKFSRLATLDALSQPYNLPDNSLSFKDFVNSTDLYSHTKASIKRLQRPSKVLYFFNTPPNITEDTLKEIFEEKCNLRPSVQVFPMNGSRCSSGLLEFDSIGNALFALMICNHTVVRSPSGSKTMKLCFTWLEFPSHRRLDGGMRSNRSQF